MLAAADRKMRRDRSVKRASGSTRYPSRTKKKFEKVHLKEESASQILRSDGCPWKMKCKNGDFLMCTISQSNAMTPMGNLNGFQTLGAVGSGLLKMVIAAEEAENLTGSIYI